MDKARDSLVTESGNGPCKTAQYDEESAWCFHWDQPRFFYFLILVISSAVEFPNAISGSLNLTSLW